MLTTALREGDHYRINGSKIYITSADKADFVQLFAKTGETGSGGGVSCFLIDKGTPGMRLGQNFELMSPDRPWELVFEDVRIHSSQMVGEPGQGWELAREFLDVGRLIHGPKALGRSQRALEMAVEFANHRQTFGQPLARRQAIQWMIADSAMEIYQCKLMILHAAFKIDRGDDFRTEVSMAKHFVANSLNRIIDRALQVHGALGYSTDTPLANMMQHARWARFADGADEIHQMRIAENTIKAFTDHGTTRTATGDLPI
jgi:acyl-CoA dehydrogenase